MSDELDKPTEEISLDKDQADCLLIVLNQHAELLAYRVENFEKHLPDQIRLMMENYEVSLEEVTKIAHDGNSLDKAMLETIPGILQEVKEIYPMLEERSKFENKIITAPRWKKS